ncbi:transposase [Aureimonas endophytica]|uniref:Transposase n=1 Tax=Aureimonas endophytica TaxID=2027858 RepID=A0A917A4A9_9HYPH|nr:IS66 family transposase [Aureimonas endophytica]GGE24407.1 transposase [Aureimonas endophytica]
MPDLPDDIAVLRAALAAAERRADLAEADAAHAKVKASGIEALVAHLTLQIEKLKRELYGARSERTARLLDQLEMQLEDAEAALTEDELAAERAAAKTATVARLERRRRGGRKPFPEHLPRERVVVSAPTACQCCGSDRLRKLGEDVTETLKMIPLRWKVVQTVREKFTCQDCERISQVPAPFHPTPRGFLGPNLLAMILFDKFGQHQPLNRQSERYAREGIDLPLSTLADQVGACVHALRPLHDLVAAHVLSAERLHGDDTTVPILAKGKTVTGRIWTYVRDNSPFGGPAPPEALYHASPDRTAEQPEEHLMDWTGILQADAYSGYGRFCAAGRSPGPLTQALCWAHARRKFFELADIAKNARRGKNAAPISPMALEAVKRIDALFAIERDINGLPAAERLASRRERSMPLLADFEGWMRTERARLSRHADVAKAMDYMLTRWDAFTRFTTDGRICLSNNAAERALRGIALGRRSWTFAGSQRGADRCALMLTMISTAKLNDIDQQVWLADVLARIADIPQTRLPELLPWNWAVATHQDQAVAA